MSRDPRKTNPQAAREHTIEFLPTYTHDLVAYLEKEYQPRCIQRGESPEDAHRYAGKVELIQRLRMQLKREERIGRASETTINL